ncbi:MAG TPA: glycoside hydrolase family 13 [Fervidobacterium sp.]|nr:glycoside hydrolase family 13 [Fervidobacterium sp.]HPZ18344.1 glycoside hydrolase family 13 [Fervidobacterium sp.]HQE49620.1 glycoside hydrolase family 13 [Fervidobacterium sp.]HUM43543.1 glycoside hydrolase family 13 [Fervidobacterium sp.]
MGRSKSLIVLCFLLISIFAFSAVSYKDGKVVFTFKTDIKATSVFLAGNFNNWSTSAMPMQLVDGVWQIAITLEPGSYQYKFVINGTTWKEDPEAPSYVDDGFGGKNGAFVLTKDGKVEPVGGQVPSTSQMLKDYEPNSARKDTIYVDQDGYVVIRLYTDAKRVFIAGTFNNWNEKDTEAYFVEDGIWEAVLELNPGIYEYKFLVDGNWVIDPNAFAYVDDGFGGKNGAFEVYEENGGLNVRAPISKGAVQLQAKNVETQKAESVVEPKKEIAKVEGTRAGVSIVDGKVIFAVKNDKAQEAYVAGTFNSWNATGLKMQLVDGYWTASLQLSPGTYEYKYVFVIGGNQVWQEDPNAPSYKPDGYGGKNGVFKVVSKDNQLSIEGIQEQGGGLAAKGTYNFEYKFKTDQTKYLLGSSISNKLSLTFVPNDDLSLKVAYNGANISEAQARFVSDNLAIIMQYELPMHCTLPWFLPFDDQETRQTGITLDYKLGSIDLVGGIGYATTKFPWIAGLKSQGFALYFGQDYFASSYSVLGTLSLDLLLGLFDIETTVLYNFNNTYVVSAQLSSNIFEVYNKFDGSLFYANAKALLDDNSIIIDGSYDFDYGDIKVSLTYDVKENYAVSANASFASTIGAGINFKKYAKTGYLKLSIDTSDITDAVKKTYLSVSGEVNF